jgi:hypothetical protein
VKITFDAISTASNTTIAKSIFLDGVSQTPTSVTEKRKRCVFLCDVLEQHHSDEIISKRLKHHRDKNREGSVTKNMLQAALLIGLWRTVAQELGY